MDTALSLLLPELTSTSVPILWWMDENTPAGQIPSSKAGVTVQTNRYDVAQQLERQQWAVQFGDFGSALLNTSFKELAPKRIVARISKEKALTHFWINQASHYLAASQGDLVLTGLKQEGIKGYFDRAKKAGADVDIWKSDKETWAASLRFPHPIALEDKQYSKLQPITVSDTKTVLSKPGVFGWEKVDQGSALLIEHLTALVETYATRTPTKALDIGCGYGFLSLETAERLSIPVIATDNNAAALLACEANAQQSHLAISCIAGDCADTVTERVDLVVCNPPFHTGKGTDNQLTERFLASAARCLNPDGLAIFVTNLHIGIEQRAAAYFGQVETPVRSDHFKLVVVKHPKP
jgi:16S rRNA (guanine1207-N2)-methyltransferase